ncbi:hypothetical protein K443DRAFT_5669 [Laccaria amethystina LaAM-08-1]|uniref:Uncharacterized protein n=1 Tax=Laccaria amethystina LaAM-08-1 TaxID=1095629 RepID=A0A0C9XDY7_9AGAR|nr:hypothetical protein K443DRAFT_5669 [Laccaria amethystina LaAM-08-1]
MQNQRPSISYMDDVVVTGKFPGISGKLIGALRFSPEGDYLAIGDDEGNLIIKETAGTWQRCRIYRAGPSNAIHAIVWDPCIPRTVVIGAANGYVNLLNFHDESFQSDFVTHRKVDGFIHCLAINEQGTQLAVAYGSQVAVFDEPFRTSDEPGHLDIALAAPNSPQPAARALRDSIVPLHIYYVNDQTILVVFYGNKGIIAYSSSPPFNEIWKIHVRRGTDIGSAALSPSKTLLAATNLQDGIDFYSLRKKAYVTTTKYQIEARLVLKIVGIEFLDDNTVIAGHSAGHIILTSPGRLRDPDQVLITEELGSIQTLTVGMVHGELMVMAVYSNGLEVEPPTIYRAQVIRQTDEREIAPMEVDDTSPSKELPHRNREPGEVTAMAASKESVEAASLKPHDQQGWSFLSVIGFAAIAIIASSYLQHPESRRQLSEYQTVALTYVSPLFNQLFSITLPEEPISTVTFTHFETIQVLQTLTTSADSVETPVVQVTKVTPAAQVTEVTLAVQVTEVTDKYETATCVGDWNPLGLTISEVWLYTHYETTRSNVLEEGPKAHQTQRELRVLVIPRESIKTAPTRRARFATERAARSVPEMSDVNAEGNFLM